MNRLEHPCSFPGGAGRGTSVCRKRHQIYSQGTWNARFSFHRRGSSAEPRSTPHRVVRIDGGSFIILQGRILEPAAVAANLERARAEKPRSPLIVAAHPEADTDALVTVLDAARIVGIESVSVATTETP